MKIKEFIFSEVKLFTIKGVTFTFPRLLVYMFLLFFILVSAVEVIRFFK